MAFSLRLWTGLKIKNPAVVKTAGFGYEVLIELVIWRLFGLLSCHPLDRIAQTVSRQFRLL
jgi:hypothetical protein